MGVNITGDPEADRVLSEDPFALLVGMLLDQQFPMERAFAGPATIRERLGTLDSHRVASEEPEAFAALCAEAPAVHRYPGSMAKRIQELARIVEETYGGRAERVWEEATDGRDLLTRLKALPGFGPQKAQIFIALLAKQLGVRPDGWEGAAGDYSLQGHRSVADVVDPESLQKVRDFKKEKKAQAKAKQA